MNTENNPKNEFTEFTELNMSESSTVKKEEKSEPAFWQSVLVGGVPGLLIGASGALSIKEAIARTEGGDGTDQKDQDLHHQGPQDAIKVAHSVSDDMSFAEAFAAARAEVGPGGAFVWHGNVYGTYRVDDPDWQNMSNEDRIEYSQHVMSQVHPTHYTATENEPSIEPVSNSGTETAPVGDDGNGDDGVEIHIVGIDQGTTQEGTVWTAGYGSYDNHLAVFIDSDGDGEVDTVQIDLNDNNHLDEGEQFNAQELDLTTEQMAAEVAIDNLTPEDIIYTDTPDYTNDADTGSYV